MKAMIILVATLLSFNAFSATYECENFGINYTVTTTETGDFESIKGILNYTCEIRDYNLDGFAIGGPDGIECTSKVGTKKELIVISYEDEMIHFLPLGDIGYTSGFKCYNTAE